MSALVVESLYGLLRGLIYGTVGFFTVMPVSYTHLTLPTILLV